MKKSPLLKNVISISAFLYCNAAVLPTVWGQTEAVPEKSDVVKSEAPTDGWLKGLNLSAGGMVTEQSDVSGSKDGNTTTLSATINSFTKFISGDSEWRNSLLLTAAQTRTPVIPEYVKSQDIIDFDSIYLFHLPAFHKIGPFFSFGLDSKMFRSRDVQAEESTYIIAYQDESVETKQGKSLKLSDPLKPMILKESLGFFYAPITSDPISAEILLGYGGRQTYADGQLAVKDDETTTEIEVVELEDKQETGIDLRGDINGKLTDGRILYSVKGELFVPYTRSNESPEDEDKDPFEKKSWHLQSTVSFKLVDWASIDWIYRLERNYSIQEEIQRTNSLLASVSVNIGDQIKADDECAKCQ